MAEHLTVDRYLRDKAMDHIDHALGRPLDPLAETYRNHFAIDADSELAAAFRTSPLWVEAVRIPGGMAGFRVTDEGRAALAAHLKTIADPHRAYEISFEGYTSLIVAPTRSKAKYRYWLRISDSCPDLTFADYCRRSTARLATPSAHPGLDPGSRGDTTGAGDA